MLYLFLASLIAFTTHGSADANQAPSRIDSKMLFYAGLTECMSKAIKMLPAVHDCEIAVSMSQESIAEKVTADIILDEAALKTECLKQQKEFLALLKKRACVSDNAEKKYLEAQENNEGVFVNRFRAHVQSLLAKAFNTQTDNVSINLCSFSKSQDK